MVGDVMINIDCQHDRIKNYREKKASGNTCEELSVLG